MVEAFDIQLFEFKNEIHKDLYEKVLDTSLIVHKENSGVNDIFLQLLKINNIKSKGYKFKSDGLTVILKPIFISILKKTGEMEKNLLVKGYEE